MKTIQIALDFIGDESGDVNDESGDVNDVSVDGNDASVDINDVSVFVGDAYMRHLQKRHPQQRSPDIQQNATPTFLDGVENPTNYKPERIQMYLSKTIQQYKSSVSREIRTLGKQNFRWQRSFYDHVVRDELSLNRIRKYIQNNPVRHNIKGCRQ